MSVREHICECVHIYVHLCTYVNMHVLCFLHVPHSHLLKRTQLPEGNLHRSLTVSAGCGLATGQTVAVTPESPDCCGMWRPGRLLGTGDSSHGGQALLGIGSQLL